MDDRDGVSRLGQGRPHPDGRALTPRLAAKAQAYLLLSAGVVGALGVLLPHPARFNETGLLSVQSTSIVAALVLFALGRRTPRWVATAGPFGAVLATAAVLLSSGSSSSPYLLFYLWVVFYAFYFLSTRQAVVLGLFALASYVVVLVVFRAQVIASPTANANEDVSALVLLTGTIAVAGAFIVLLRERLGRLIIQLTDAASTDPLTGLLNRRGFHQAIETEVARAQRSSQSFSLLLGDCDFFKHLNDSLGHHAGDDALMAIGRMLEDDRRRIDVAARIGGEEFALILPNTGQHEAFLVAERLRIRFSGIFGNHPVPLTMSLGVATYPDHADSDDGLFRAADDALYAAKVLGRDRSVLHSPEIEGILAAGRRGAQNRDEAQLATVLNLAEALDMRDTGTARHSQTVGRYCELMARQLGLPGARVDRIRTAGVLHDIGKIGVADSILRKPGALTDTEYDAMKKHPEIGAKILGGSGLDDVREWILAHHERPDGRGYPFALEGTEIPLEARILAVGDAYEAMTSDRVYRKAIGAEAARAELRRCAGRQFDGEVVEAFLTALGEGLGDSGAAGRATHGRRAADRTAGRTR